ncbi:MAG: ferredoxin [Candidatus Ancaeobacter aquaticus]|nr:ferredoxin [Candidatus Ancaeobacter aquaticus]
MKTIIDKNICICCGLCVEICPVVFALDDDGKAISKVDKIAKQQQNKANEAASSCPVNAIKIK